MKKIRIKRYPPKNLPGPKSLWATVAVPPLSESDIEFAMLCRANPKHPVIIESLSETVDIDVNDKAFKELVWLFKKYRVPFKPVNEGIEVKCIETRSNCARK